MLTVAVLDDDQRHGTGNKAAVLASNQGQKGEKKEKDAGSRIRKY